MITVAEALDALFALAPRLAPEQVDLRHAAGRVLAVDAVATRAQPPFAAAAMDGYALPAQPQVGDRFRVVGAAQAGRGWPGRLLPGEAVRIFTGAPVPAGADWVVAQEDTTRMADEVTLAQDPGDSRNIRPAGADFAAGFALTAPRRLRPADIALLAAMNVPRVSVARQPEVALISTGDELVMPGETPGPDQIVAANTFGLAALFTAAGARVRVLPIARDNRAAIVQAFDLARGADLIVTIGGASVGDHDLVAPVVADLGGRLGFHKVAMRPGKPLMAGQIGAAMMIGLPGNPVSAMVCGQVFVAPVLAAMQGLPAAPAPRARAPLLAPLPANGPREHYLRAMLTSEGITAFDRQDSALLTVLADADALLVRPVGDGPRAVGDLVDYIRL